MDRLRCQAYRGACTNDADRVLLDSADRLRLSCASHTACCIDCWGGRSEDVETAPLDRLPPRLLELARLVERQHQRDLRKKVAALEARIECSEERERAAQAALTGQRALELEAA